MGAGGGGLNHIVEVEVRCERDIAAEVLVLLR